MEITLEMFNNDYVSALLVAGDYCRLSVQTVINVFPPNFDTYTINTTFLVEQFFEDNRESEFHRYQSLVDALQKFNEIEELG